MPIATRNRTKKAMKYRRSLEYLMLGICVCGISAGIVKLIGVMSSQVAEPPTFETRYEYGPAFPAQMIEHTFELTNPFDETLKITKIHRGCGCITARFGTETVGAEGNHDA